MSKEQIYFAGLYSELQNDGSYLANLVRVNLTDKKLSHYKVTSNEIGTPQTMLFNGREGSLLLVSQIGCYISNVLDFCRLFSVSDYICEYYNDSLYMSGNEERLVCYKLPRKILNAHPKDIRRVKSKRWVCNDLNSNVSVLALRALADDRLLVATDDGLLTLFNYVGRPISLLEGHNEAILNITVLDMREFITVERECIRLWKLYDDIGVVIDKISTPTPMLQANKEFPVLNYKLKSNGDYSCTIPFYVNYGECRALTINNSKLAIVPVKHSLRNGSSATFINRSDYDIHTFHGCY